MLDLYVNYYNEAKLKEYVSDISEANLKDILMDDVMYAVVENEKHEKLFIFGILGKAKIYENNPFDIVPNCTIRGTGWVSSMPCIKNVGTYIETPDNVFMMLNIIKENEKNGIKTVRHLLEKYCIVNCIHNYQSDYIVG